ncbi:MAG: tyrosine-protein phosphatase [Gammaproteobacteria bacterium]|nr:tyrosine-protein phosphatase [Gammaproteobacteria bacterium]MYG13487.1 tyrosine-protein phosphatase [Gammaproteobacteria bacterium]MYK29239.1 tyrosine-protein phosphatase [Gammaproteobacteria bacterium]
MAARLISFFLLFVFASTAVADPSMSYRRLLPLEGGSNFRDLGGYRTADGQTVARGMLFRSGAMTGLTDADMAYLDGFGIKTIVDLRSDEEISLYPNHWAAKHRIEVVTGGYSFAAMMSGEESGERPAMSELYPRLLESIGPQIKTYFDEALGQGAPMVVNCSAGQDRTGIVSALMLLLLGVPEPTVIEDYLLSTDFRRPAIEDGGVDLAEAAKTNAFAAMMLEYRKAMPHPDRPNPLVTSDGVPYLAFVIERIRDEYGSVEAYAEKELGINAQDLAALRRTYLR